MFYRYLDQQSSLNCPSSLQNLGEIENKVQVVQTFFEEYI